MSFVVLATAAILFQYMYFSFQSGFARGKAGLKAPAMTGDENFERHARVHMNTAEQLIITLPAMWMCAFFFRPDVAAVGGVLFFVGRFIYRSAYVADPATRTVGFVIGFFTNIALILASVYGAVMAM